MDDTGVKHLSDALRGQAFDWIVTGSIAATETVKAIRALRRLGAQVWVTMTKGAERFITSSSCAWASGNPVITEYGGFSDHIGRRDGLIVAPLSASFAAKIVAGICDSPALSLVASCLGQKIPTIVHPNMHVSLGDNPFWQEAWVKLQVQVCVIDPLIEEGKQKFISPPLLAEHIAHYFNKGKGQVVICMGRTEGAIDDVRYISNSSSGELGTLIASELYRRGFTTHIVCGPAERKPQSYSTMTWVRTPAEMSDAVQRRISVLHKPALVMAAAVLDFMPQKTVVGKISSRRENLTLTLQPVAKLIQDFKKSDPQVVFKVLADFNIDRDMDIVRRYILSTSCSLLVVNPWDRIATRSYRAWLFSPDLSYSYVEGKEDASRRICDHIEERLQLKGDEY